MTSHAPRKGDADWRPVDWCRDCGAKVYEMRSGNDWARQLEHRRGCPTIARKAETKR